jgi:hypothetical protein
MGTQVGSLLKKQLIVSVIDDEEKMKKATPVINSPKFQSWIAQRDRDRVKNMLEQEHECDWIVVRAKRNGSVVAIDWEFDESVGNANEYHVSGTIWEIDLEPDSESLAGGLIASAKGNGWVRLELEEGSAYYVDFLVTRVEEVRDSRDIQRITFNIAIPLSDERRTLLRKAVELDQHPEEAIRSEFEEFFSKRETFDELYKCGIERIKAKNLPSEEAEEQIGDFKEYVAWMKEKFKM